MAENQIPKATMANFIRQRIKDKRKISAEFIQTMLDLSKEYIDKVGALSNQICEKQGKKTISTDHFYRSLKQLHMEDVIPTLQNTQEYLKKKQQHKQEVKEKVQENIQRRNEMNKQQQNESEQKPCLEVNKQLKPIVIEDDEDFGGFLNEDNDNNE